MRVVGRRGGILESDIFSPFFFLISFSWFLRALLRVVLGEYTGKGLVDGHGME